jgi:hypothetical protein
VRGECSFLQALFMGFLPDAALADAVELEHAPNLLGKANLLICDERAAELPPKADSAA